MSSTTSVTSVDPSVAVVLPVLNEGEGIARALARLGAAGVCEIVVVDGGSTDDTPRQLRDAASGWTRPPELKILSVPRGRACQMNRGADAARADVLIFLHADVCLPDGAVGAVRHAISRGALWGRFDVRLDAPGLVYRIIGALMNIRSHLSGICTGDQAIFVRRDALRVAGGFPDIELMEDIALSKWAKTLFGRPVRLRARVVVSARYWQRHGVVRSVLRMWWLRGLFFLGASPGWLARQYHS